MTYINLTSYTVAVCNITLVLIEQVMNSKLVTGHGTTGYRFTQATTVLGHGPMDKREKEGENVQARAQGHSL